jgi:hypothetical protein
MNDSRTHMTFILVPLTYFQGYLLHYVVQFSFTTPSQSHLASLGYALHLCPFDLETALWAGSSRFLHRLLLWKSRLCRLGLASAMASQRADVGVNVKGARGRYVYSHRLHVPRREFWCIRDRQARLVRIVWRGLARALRGVRLNWSLTYVEIVSSKC